ncbi:dATP pyrophosphohydrolase [Actinobacillus equuli]|nr:dATP pyrophosphohydrolase [Actinobacillus equuli]
MTGSLEPNEQPFETAIREVKEEIGINILAEKLTLTDCNESVEFEIFRIFGINTRLMSRTARNIGFTCLNARTTTDIK